MLEDLCRLRTGGLVGMFGSNLRLGATGVVVGFDNRCNLTGASSSAKDTLRVRFLKRFGCSDILM